jgi:hypothetical protein
MKAVPLLAILSMLACTAAESTAPPNMDGSVDSGTDSGTDSGLDAGVDSGVDSGLDSGLDERRVFVTNTIQNANFGGIAGADALCASQATAAGLEGEFKAWLSTAVSPVADRLTQSSVPYVLVDGTMVADDWVDLVDGFIDAPINLDANGLLRGGDVWTGTLPSGLSYANGDCAGFTDESEPMGLCGSTTTFGGGWTTSATPVCSTELRLYCFEE